MENRQKQFTQAGNASSDDAHQNNRQASKVQVRMVLE